MTKQQKIDKLTKRQSEILTLVEETGYATLENLAGRYGVSMQTVRRDIIALSDAGRLQRFHGGAGPIEQEEATRLDYQAKRNISQSEKQVIAQKASGLIEDGATLFLDVGTTLECCAALLAKRRGLTIFTNSMPAAMKFDPHAHQIILLGGKMAGRDGSIVGVDALNLIRDVKLDVALIGCSTIDQNGRVMDFDLEKISIKKAAMQAADKSFLLATHNKFGKSALAVIAHLDQFNEVIRSGDKHEDVAATSAS